jgi:hypothetical protein
MHQVVTMVSPDEDHNQRRKKSYLYDRNRRTSDKVDRKTSVKDSLTQFLAHAQDEDLIFHACSSPPKVSKRPQAMSSSTEHGTPKQYKGGNSSFGTLSQCSDHVSRSIDIPIRPLDQSAEGGVADEQTRQIPFDRRTLRRSKSTKGKRRSSRSSAAAKPSHAKGRERETHSDSDDGQSFADDDDDDEVSISSGEGRSQHLSSPRSAGLSNPGGTSKTTRSQPSPAPLRRTQSLRGGHAAPARLSTASAGDSHRPRPPRRTQSDSRGLLSSNLADLERHSRRHRMKQAYRGRSQDARFRADHVRGSSHADDTDGEESVASRSSIQSTASTMSRRRSGLEGGALNAFLADERVAQNASRGLGIARSGGSVVHEQDDEKYLRERQSRQDLIMDVARKEKWQYQARAAREAELKNKEQAAIDGSDDECSSDEDGLNVKKKRGMIGNLKRAVRKTAKTSKSAAKGTVNVVKDPKRAAKKVGGFAKEMGKETAKMVLDPSLAAKRGKNGIKGTVNLTTKVTGTVAKGSLGLTTSLAKNSLNVTTMVVGSTIDGAGKVVHGAAGFLKKDKDDGGIDYDDYDSRALTSRLRESSLIDRFVLKDGHENDENNDDKQDDDDDNLVAPTLQRRNNGSRKSAPASSSVFVPTLDTGGGSGSWDL